MTMRRYIDIVEAIRGIDWDALREKKKHPYIDAGYGPHVAEVEMLYVPKEQRGGGVGKKLYADWEASLPPEITRVELEAVDYGDGFGNSRGWWENMGFEYKYDVEETTNVSDEILYRMWKGVNGHPTPKPIPIGYSDDEDETVREALDPGIHSEDDLNDNPDYV